jgi:2-polyprenyl-6-methoxyphenol hydroxylase-like FAD-dependent oxidoreductase
VETHFGLHIVDIQEHEKGVTTTLSNGSKADFDLVVGADGLHSHIRKIAFGPEEAFEKHLGYTVAAFQLPHYTPRDERAYIMHTSPHRQVARFSMRDDQTLFLFTFKSNLLEKQPTSEAEEKDALHTVFGDMGWEIPQILERMHEVQDIYFDSISQICMPSWTKGRIALIGDAAACASLLAGEGTGLAIIEAYVLAGELHRSQGDYTKAFEQYNRLLQPFIRHKQKAALSFAEFFAPSNRLSLAIRNTGIRLTSHPILANIFVGRSLKDNVDLLDYMALSGKDL